MLGLLLGLGAPKLIQEANSGSQISSDGLDVQLAEVTPSTDYNKEFEEGIHANGAMFGDPFLGSIVMFAGNFAPRGWALCDGQLLPISQYSALFSILGTTYGGDGRTTFALPDLRGRVSIHPGNGPGLPSYRLGERGGASAVTLTEAQMPSHNHAVVPGARNGAGDETNPVGGFMASASTDLYAESTNTTMGATQSANTGGGQSHTNIQPYLCVNYIIALQGTFPSRN